MTLPSRRKRPTTAHAASLRARTGVSLLVLGWLATGACQAQQLVAVAVPVPPAARVREGVQTTLPIRIDSGVMPVQMRQLPPNQRDDATVGYQIPIQLPGPERLFRLDSEANLIQRIRQESRDRKPEEMT